MTDPKDSLESLTPAKRRLYELLLEQERAGDESATQARTIPAIDRTGSLPLSFPQQRLWFLDRLDPSNRAYNVPLGVLLRGRLETSALAASLNEVIRRHEVLRTRFVAENGRPRQVIHEARALRMERVDLRGLAPATRETELGRIAIEHNLQAYDLTRGALVRAALVTLEDEEQVLLLNMHHIVTDSWSVGLCVREMAALYEAFAADRPSPLPVLPCQYVDYAAWQHQELEGDELEPQMAYWREVLSGSLPTLELPTDRPRQAIRSSQGRRFYLRISPEVNAALRALAREEEVTLFVTLLAVFNVFLHRMTGKTDLLVGTTVAGRRRPELESLIGLFINTLVLRGDLAREPTFRELLGRLRESTYGALEHQDVRFERLVDELQPSRDLSRNPLYQVQFSVQSAPMQAMQRAGLEMVPLDVESGTARFDLELIFWDWGESLKGYMEYSTRLFDHSTIGRMVRGFEALVKAVLDDPDAPIRRLLPVTGSEAHQLLVEWNDTAAPALLGESILPLIEDQADRRPDAPAVIFGDDRLSYRQLNERANQLACHLRELGVGPEAAVGVCVERSFELIVGLLGILKAGGAYLPLDPAYPQERLRQILEDARVAVVLAREDTLPSLPEHPATIVVLDRDWEPISRRSTANPPRCVTAATPAYVIYTSGSTGTPKGVVSCHGGLHNRLLWMQEVFQLNDRDRVLQKTSFTFDVSVWEFFWPHVAGAAMVLARPGGQGDPAHLAGLIDEHEVTTCHFVPSMLKLFLDDPRVGDCASLRRVILSGEALSRDLEQRFLDRFQAGLFNLYGPTEASIDVTWLPCERRAPGSGVPIGRPIANTAIRILDRRLEPTALGVPGELHIAGAGLARGYLRRPELTAETFVPDPASATSGARLYKTGDLARTLPDGRIEFLGRLDHQVKVRGFRIELGEIEATLIQHPAVEQAVAMSRPDERGDQRLVAYLVAGEGQSPNVSELRSFLTARLPEYVVPSAFVALEALPLTPSGKVDRRSLPAPDGRRPEQEAAYAAPRSAVERAIAEIWKEVLSIDKVGLRDNFFDLGGDSLLLAQVHSKLQTVVDAEISMIDLFRYTTISALTDFLRQDDGDGDGADERERVEPLPAPRAGLREGSPDIAIIAMTLRFPGSDSPEQLWSNLCAGVESVSFFDDETCLAAGVDPERLADPNYVRAEAVIEDVDQFAGRFFGISPREAELTDPQQRIFLELASEALERAGYSTEHYDGEIGVFGGVSMSSYLLNNLQHLDAISLMSDFQSRIQILTSNEKDFLAQKLSYLLKLSGPSVNVQTACSSALVAVHMACQSLLNGECRMALAGAAQIRVPQKVGYLYQVDGLPSPDGHCRPFDAKAMGTVHGNGAGLVVLKPLDDAVADGDHIYAVIKGSAVNNDGDLKVGFTAPSFEGMTRVTAKALAGSGIDPATVGFVEAHGTGTDLGDTLEASALTHAFRRYTDRKQYCWLGSVKGNIGHLDEAAGIAGLIKAALVLEQKQIPPTVHFSEPNPNIGLDNTPFRVNAELVDWTHEDDETPRRAAVNIFGIGGTNAHALLEEAPPAAPSGESRPWQLLVLSARTTTALHRATDNLSAFLRGRPDAKLADVAYTLQVGRRGFTMRRAVACRSAEDALDALKTLDPQRVWTGAHGDVGGVAFLFPGEGVDPAAVAAELYELEPVFREQLDRCLELAAGGVGETLRQALCRADAEALDWGQPTAVTQVGIFAVEYALARLWKSWGIEPQAVLGYGLGEVVAACLAGVFSLEDALALATARGRLLETLPTGAMLAVACSPEAVEPWLGPELHLAAVGGPEQVVLSGTAAAIAEVEERSTASGVEVRRLPVSRALHSPLVEPIAEALVDEARQLDLRPPRISWLSSLSGEPIAPQEATDPACWGRHLHATLRIGEGLGQLFEDPSTALLEIGPGKMLTSWAEEHPDYSFEQPLVPALGPEGPAEAALAAALGSLWTGGVEVDWRGYSRHQRRRRLILPTYPFERERYWIERRPESDEPGPRDRKKDPAEWFYLPAWKRAPHPLPSPAGPWRWLLLGDGDGLTSELIRRLGAGGHEVIPVTRGERFEQREDGYSIRPREEEDYDALLEDLRAGGRTPEKILHLWAMGPEGTAPAAGDEVPAVSLFHLGRALGRFEPDQPVAMGVVTAGLREVSGDEPLPFEGAALLGLCEVLPREVANLSCRSIDVAGPAPARPGDWLAERLVAELADAAEEERVAYRGNLRSIHSWESFRPPLPEPPAERLREAGVYLILPGLSGAGAGLAGYLARRCQARLVLVEPPGFPAAEDWDAWLAANGDDHAVSRKIRRARALEEQGGQLLVTAVDTAQRSRLEAAVAQARERFGAVNGVVYACETASAGWRQRLLATDLTVWENLILSQGRVLADLEEILDSQSVDFCLVVSGGAVAVGGGTPAGAAIGNWIDLFVERHNRVSPAPWLHLSLDPWREEIAEQGHELWPRILATAGLSRVLVTAGDPGRSVTTAADDEAAPTLHQRPDSLGEYKAPRNTIEQLVAEIWEEVLGVEKIGIHDDLFELGANSLLATQVVSRFRDLFQVQVPLQEMNELRTIADTTAVLGRHQIDDAVAEKVVALMAELEELSENDAERMATGGDDPS
ncbi:MAG: amino acid adenylation domain-containing protein [bacterium]|nr:amino acid adenylation domain-containing protein [bacterium]